MKAQIKRRLFSNGRVEFRMMISVNGPNLGHLEHADNVTEAIMSKYCNSMNERSFWYLLFIRQTKDHG